MKQKITFKYKKCHICSYALGKIKCIISPCIRCIMSKRQKNPFSFWDSTKDL